MSALIHLWMGGSKVFPSYALNPSLALRKPLAPWRLHEAQSENHSSNRPGGCLLATNIATYIAFDGSPERPATVLEGFVFTVLRRYRGAGVKAPALVDLEHVV